MERFVKARKSATRSWRIGALASLSLIHIFLGESLPLLDELLVRRSLDRFEVIPGGQMADQRLGVDAGKLFLADREGDDGDVRGLDSLVAQFLVEGHVGVAVDEMCIRDRP